MGIITQIREDIRKKNITFCLEKVQMGLTPPPCVFAEASDVTRIVNDMFIRPGVAGADLQTAS